MPKYFSEEGQNGNGTLPPDVQKLVEEALADKAKALEEDYRKRFNESEKGIREKYQREAEKAKLSAEEKLKLETEEKFNATQAERDAYKAKYRDMMVRAKLNDAGLPIELYIDSKKLDVEDEKLDEVIKSLKKTHDSIISGGKTSPSTTPKTTSNTPTKLIMEEMEELATSDPAKYRELRKQQLYKK
ncbi:MAG: hypothetical protein EOM74_04935 [Methanomicrobia archaeon]|nr:hypothetical protein [Methanomicrobia archaeon]